jgi:hypothetical protein
MPSVVDGLFGQTSGTKTTTRTFSDAPSLSGSGSLGQSFNFELGGNNNFVNIPGVSEQRQGIYNRTNDLIGAVQNDILSLRSLENPFIQARVRPTQEKFANLRADTQRGLARRGVFGTLANNELIRINREGTRAVADQGALATAESFEAIFQRQEMQAKLHELMRGLNQDEATQALKELELLANIAGTSLSAIKETSTTTTEEQQGNPAEGVGTLLETLTDLIGDVGGALTTATNVFSDIQNLFDGSITDVVDDGFESVSDVVNDVVDAVTEVFNPSGDVTQIDPVDHMGDTGGPGDSGGVESTVNTPPADMVAQAIANNAAGAENIAATFGAINPSNLTAAYGVAGQAGIDAALATGGVDAFTGLTAEGLTGGFTGQATAGGAMAGTAGAILGGIAPLALVAFGKMQGDAKRKAARAWAAPYIRAAANATPVTRNGITGLPITIHGKQYLVNPHYKAQTNEYAGKVGALKAYDPQLGEYGEVGPKGWISDLELYNEHANLGNDDDATSMYVEYDKSPYVYTNPANWSQRTIHQPLTGANKAKKEMDAAKVQLQAAKAAGNLAAMRAAEVEKWRKQREYDELRWGDTDSE